MLKVRQSNIELLRIVAMFLVLVVHANYWRIGAPTACEAVSTPLSTYVRILIQHLASPCVNVFILISGYFAIRPKLKSICNLYFLLAFWGGVSVLVDGGTIRCCILRMTFPFLGWFIPAYLGLYLLSPILNQYAEHEDPVRYRRFLILFFILQTFFDFVYQGWSIFDRPIFNHGYSILSFVPLYLLGRYLKLHRPIWLRASFARWFSAYAGLFLISSFVVFSLLWINGGHSSRLLAKLSHYGVDYAHLYTSPICLAGSIFLFLAFDSLSFSNRIVNRIAASVLGVFCFQDFAFYAPMVKSIYANHSGFLVLAFDGLFIVGVYLAGVLIDQIRLFIWNAASRSVFKD